MKLYFHPTTTPTMQQLLSQHYQHDLRAGINDLEDARSLGEIRADIEAADAYRSIMSAVGSVGLTAAMNPAQLAPKEQIAMLKHRIDALRS